MNESLSFNFLEGNSKKFCSNFVTELKQQHIYYGFDSMPHNGKIKFFTDNIDKDILTKSFNILEKSLKSLPEFEISIEALGRSCLVNEKDDLRKTINDTFLNSIIYNPETGSHFLFNMKDLKEDSEIKNYKDLEIQFFKTSYLDDFSKLPKFFALFGRSKFLDLLKLSNNIFSMNFIKELFIRYPVNFYIDKNKEFIFAYSSPYFEENFGELSIVYGLDALKNYGIDILEEATEKGYTEIF